MICQFTRIINSLTQDFWKISLEEMYKRILKAVRSRQCRFFIPSRECYCGGDDYILWGTYPRARIIDMQYMACEAGEYQYEEVEIKDFSIQRIKDKLTGATHAILDEFFIPYKQYSLRFVLFHLHKFFNQRVSQEAYCLENEIEVKTFRLWLKWLKEHITLLYGFGLTRSDSDNWQMMSQWIQTIYAGISDWMFNSLRKLNRALFQDRKMPENTKYQNYERPG